MTMKYSDQNVSHQLQLEFANKNMAKQSSLFTAWYLHSEWKYKCPIHRLADLFIYSHANYFARKPTWCIKALRKSNIKKTNNPSISLLFSVGNAVNVAHGSLPGAIQPVDNQDLRRAKMARHASFNITPTSLVVQRQVSSAPCSPQPESAGKRGLWTVKLCHSSFSLTVYYSRTYLHYCLTQILPFHHSTAKPTSGLLQKGNQWHSVSTAVRKHHWVSSTWPMHSHILSVFLAFDLSALMDHTSTAKAMTVH